MVGLVAAYPISDSRGARNGDLGNRGLVLFRKPSLYQSGRLVDIGSAIYWALLYLSPP
jgi:hypothetical protein